MNYPALLTTLLEGASLTRAQSREVFTALMHGELSSAQIAGLLTALRAKGETLEEITGAAEAMRASALPVQAPKGVLVDTCGTGGDRQGTLNISTAAAFVVAGAGYTVAKHGNRSISSRCGSADVLEAAGIPPQLDPETASQALKDIGIAFLFAPAFHPATRHAATVRKDLGVRTLFNLLGPLTNPAHPNVQVVGVYAASWVKPLAHVLVALGCEEGFVVHGQGHDEVVLQGTTSVAEICHGRVSTRSLSPVHFGLKRRPEANLTGGDASTNLKMLLQVLEGEAGDARDAVCMNAALAIQAAARSRHGQRRRLTLKDAMRDARQSLDSGSALARFQSYKAFVSGQRP